MDGTVLEDVTDPGDLGGLGDVDGVELIDGGLGLRDVDARTDTGAVPPDQPGQRADRADPAHHMVGEDRRRVVERVPGVLGCGLLRGPQTGHPDRRPHQRAVTHLPAPRAGVAERAALGEHQARVELAQPLVGEAQRGQRSRLEVGEHRIGGGDQAGEQFGAGRAAQFQTQSQVVAVRAGERLADRLVVPLLAQTVGIGRTLDLDHLGAQIAEQPAQLTTGDDDTQIDDPDALEWPRTHRPGGRWRESCCPPDHIAAADGRGRGSVAGVLAVDHPVADGDAGADSRRQFGVDERPHLGQVLGLQRLRRGQDGGDRHPVRLTVGHQLRHGLAREEVGDQRTQLTECLGAGRDGVEDRVLEVRGLPQPGAQSAPLPRRQHADPDVAVAAREDRIGVLIPGPATPPLGGVAGGRRLPLGPERRVQRENHGVEPREVDVIACTAT